MIARCRVAQERKLGLSHRVSNAELGKIKSLYYQLLTDRDLMSPLDESLEGEIMYSYVLANPPKTLMKQCLRRES